MDKAAPSIDSIFFAALEKTSPEERASYLDEVCGEDVELRRRVERLLKAHPKAAGGFLESPPAELQPTIDLSPVQEGPGAVIGPYKLLEQIGEGGFGVVYMAEQREPICRKVALKIIKPGMDTKEVIARFEAERQALALMDHPHIARVLDAGATDSGRPYFVMELVRGIPITDYCDQNNLTPRERLGLFISVCQAVQHAHQKGIIHRDVKPNNVLVTLHDGKPVIKVIDFGVAKAIDRRLTERTLFTRFAEMIGTPLYMSPEQAEMSGLDVDTRTDIYSLGVLLYELLTGATPFDKERLGKAAYDEIRRIIREEEPPRPSTRVSTLGKTATAVSEHRNTEPRRLSALLRGDLDWIVMKSLEKDRTRRYETAKDFANDVQHYLEDLPVEARAPSALYRLRKLMRRYRVAAATVALIAATLVVATVFSTWMAFREMRLRQQLQVSMDVAEQARQDAEEERDRAGKAKELAERERQRAEEEAEKARKAAADAELALDVIGTALGAGEGTRPGNPDQTVSEMLEKVAKRLDESPQRNFYVEANLRQRIGLTYWITWRPKAAETQFRLAVEAHRKISGESNVRTADSLFWLAITCHQTGKVKESEDHLRRCIEVYRGVGGEEAAQGEARALGEIVVPLLLQGQAQLALEFASRALPLLRQSFGDSSIWTGWGTAHLAECHGALGDTQQEISNIRQALAIFQRARDSEAQWHMWTRLGDALRKQGKLADAKEAVSHALQLSETLGVIRMRRQHESTLDLSQILFRLQDWQAAETIHRQFLNLEAELGEKDPRLAEHRARLVCTLSAQGKDKEAEAVREQALRGATAETQWQLWITCGDAFREQGRLFEAQDAYGRALLLSESLEDPRLGRRDRVRDGLSRVLIELRNWQGLEACCRDFLRLADSRLARGDAPVVGARYDLAWALREQGMLKETESTYREILSDLRQAAKDGKAVWWGLADSVFVAELVSMTEDGEASLKETLKTLRVLQHEVKGSDFISDWWYSACSRGHKKLREREAALEHARLWVKSSANGELYLQQRAVDFLACLLREGGQSQEAESVLRTALADMKGKFGDNHVITHYARADLAELLVELKKYAEAETLLQQAEKGLLSEAKIPARQRQRIVRLLGHLYEAWGKTEQASVWRTKLEKVAASEPNKPKTTSPSGK